MIHAVGRASPRAPRLIDLTWGRGERRVTLVGKGIAFDTGGLDIKPASAMLIMKKDMGGAATALALAHMIMAAKLDVRLRVLVPAAENSIAGNAFRPGDVLKSRAGKTVEIGNTDAEGRLVLADALALADEERPDTLATFSTLTGAARVALGPELPPLYTDDDALPTPSWRPATRWAIRSGACRSGPRYEANLDSAVADMNNVSESPFAGSVTAALFLRRFVQQRPSFCPLRHLRLAARCQGARSQGRRTAGSARHVRGVVRAASPLKARMVRTVVLDRRRNAYRDDLAAEGLRGKVVSPRYATGAVRKVVAAAVPLRATPDGGRELDDGSPVRRTGHRLRRARRLGLGATRRRWLRGLHALSSLASDARQATHRVTAAGTWLFPAPDIKSSPSLPLSMNAMLAVAEVGQTFARLEDDRFVPIAHIAPLEQFATDFVAVAESFLGAPYLWGGKTRLGLDCSGLVQVALQACGHACPRDSDMQAGGDRRGGGRRRRLGGLQARRHRVLEGPRRHHARRRAAVACQCASHGRRDRAAGRRRRPHSPYRGPRHERETYRRRCPPQRLAVER